MRREGISAEIYPDAAKMKKQMSYADAQAVPFVAIIGESELASGTITLKNMSTGEQQQVTAEEAIAIVAKA
jgi:histidyl-tRNA synthetase